ncbi:MAG: hypothetical protein MI922_18895, partial [Bacteroidales bacterium]|nr:hypothetical protein [Bacteroidales bacterium]
MKKVLLCLGITLLIFQHSANGQYIDYSLMLAQTTPGGTARSTAMGGAWGALGGDFYSAVQNPAGLGFYRDSELTFTPELLINQTQATYYGSEHSDFTFNPNMNSIGYVYASSNESGNLKGFSFAFGYNKLNNFNQNIFIKGSNGYSSFSDAARLYLMEQDYYDPNFTQDLLNGDIHPGQPFFTNLFWDSFVVDYDSDSNEYWVNQGDTYARYPVDQEFTIERSGKANEWSFAMGFNINHKLYLGGSFAFISLKYNEKLVVGEYDYDFTEEVKINGVGYTGKLGAIYKPVNALRIGLAWHLPVFYNIDDRFSSQLNFDSGDIYSPEFDYADYTYSNITPSKYVGSLALIPNKFMLVSADFEYINYSNMQLLNGQDNYNFSQENDDISNIFYPA